MAGRILVIRGGAIGDFVLTLPAISLLREGFPDATIEILGYKHIVSLAEGRFYAQSIRSIEYGPLALCFVPKSKPSEELVEYFRSFNQVISYLFDPDCIFENNLREFGVKNYLSCSPKITDLAHAAIQLAQPLERMALFLEEPGARLYPSEADRAAAREFLSGFEDFVAIHVGSGSEAKNWPLECWKAVCESMQKEGRRVLLVGGEADLARIEGLRSEFGEGLRYAENFDLPLLAAILERSAVFMGHDSGISHIAAAVGARCLLLFGPTDPDIWAPKNPGVTVLRKGSMSEIGVDDLLSAV